MRFAALLLASVAVCARAADDPRSWPTWLQQRDVESAASTFVAPDTRTLSSLRANRSWLERWTAQPPAVTWDGIARDLVVKYQQNPLRASRVFAYVQTAIHDALVVCARRGCKAEVRPIAMHAAASHVLDHLYPDETRGRLEALGHSAASAVLAASGGHAQAELAWQVGRSVADNAVRRALYDGWDLPRLATGRPAWKSGVWRASPPLNMHDPVEPNAVHWLTWVLKNSGEIEPPPPPTYGSGTFWKEVEEVRAVRTALTPEEKRIADDWNLGAGSVTPPGVWNMRAKDLVVAHRLDAARAALVFSTLDVAMADAMLACWHAKFKWWTERPVTVIRASRDPNFMPHLVTPGFPSYVSGHASASGAAAEVLSSFFPAERANLQAMADEAALSRLYGGIHYRSDNEQGLALARLADLSPQSAATTR